MEVRASLLELALCVSEAADLVDRHVVDHHRRVAYIAHRIAAQMGLSEADRGRVTLAAALHDIGALSLGERLRALDFDVRLVEHAEPGYLLLRDFAPFADIAPIVRTHHVEWADAPSRVRDGVPVDELSHVLFVADRASVLFDASAEPLGQRKRLLAEMREGAGRRFMPEAVTALARIGREESFWFDIVTLANRPGLLGVQDLAAAQQVTVDLGEFARMLARIVDFRSRYTASHSSGVAASAGAIAEALGISGDGADEVRVAGGLHDLGKLSVPVEVLEKPGKLDREESAVVRAHAFHTGRILSSVPALARVADWAGHHHERLDGSGYPDHLTASKLSQGARIVAAADVFSALSEDRPYRQGMGLGRVLHTMDHMAHVRRLDAHVVNAVRDCAGDVSDARREAAEAGREAYELVAGAAVA